MPCAVIYCHTVALNKDIYFRYKVHFSVQFCFIAFDVGERILVTSFFNPAGIDRKPGHSILDSQVHMASISCGYLDSLRLDAMGRYVIKL